MYTIGSAFHTTCLLLHSPPLLSGRAFSAQAVSRRVKATYHERAKRWRC